MEASHPELLDRLHQYLAAFQKGSANNNRGLAHSVWQSLLCYTMIAFLGGKLRLNFAQ